MRHVKLFEQFVNEKYVGCKFNTYSDFEDGLEQAQSWFGEDGFDVGSDGSTLMIPKKQSKDFYNALKDKGYDCKLIN